MSRHPRVTAGGRVTHFVLTRFNVRMPIYQHPGDDWLPERVRLFEHYCLPSFAAQTVTEWTWLIFADAGSPSWLKERLEADVARLGEIVYVEGIFTAETAAAAVAARTSTRWVITTRVDNDDAVAGDFVEAIQQRFAEQQLELVNLVNGAQYSQRRVYSRPYTRNPFISLIEQVESDQSVRTVFVRRHYELDHVGPVQNVGTDHPMWLQVVHGDNVLTELVGLRTRPDRVVPFFACTLDLERTGPSFLVDWLIGTLRIAWRLLRQPHRVVDLAQTLLARRRAPTPMIRS